MTEVVPCNLNEDGGVKKQILTEGKGDEMPPQGSKVTVHYTGKLLDGTVFDSSKNRGEKFTFNLGKGEVIKAWDIGVATMKRGEICELVCAPKYAYGERGSPPTIPPNSTLIFEVELFDWEGEDITPESDKGIIKDVVVEGEGYTTPNDGASVEIKILGSLGGKVFDERVVKYVVSEAESDLNLPPAIDIAVKKMKKSEECRITVKPKYGYGGAGCAAFDIPASSTLKYTLKLLEFEKAKETWEMTDAEKIAESEIVKEKGTKLLKGGRVKDAATQYKKIGSLLEDHEAKEDGSEEEKTLLEKWNKIKLAGFLNLALCQIKLKDYADAVSSCNGALELDPTNEKALHRRSDALFNQYDYSSAKEGFAELIKNYPENKLARTYHQKCVTKLREAKDAEMKKYRGMFDKFVTQDEEHEIRKKVEQQNERAKAKAVKKSEMNGKDEPVVAEAGDQANGVSA